MKRHDAVADIRKHSSGDLVRRLGEARRRLLELSFTSAFRKQKNVHEARELRHSIARMETILRENIAGEASQNQAK